jgi:hypothetical protein
VAVAAVLTRTWPQLLPAAGLLFLAAVLLLLGGPTTEAATEEQTEALAEAGSLPARQAARLEIPTLLLTAAAGVPILWYVADVSANVRAGLRPNDDISAGLSHWPMQVAVVLAILATAGLTAFHQSGWQLSAWTVTVGTAWLGVLSVVFPHHAGSFGLLGGSVAILWSILFGGATLRSMRRLQASHPG